LIDQMRRQLEERSGLAIDASQQSGLHERPSETRAAVRPLARPTRPLARPTQSQIVLNGFTSTVSAHCNKFSQNRWFFAILPNSGGFANFPHKCGGFLELTLSI
jgi:hypothetical protein